MTAYVWKLPRRPGRPKAHLYPRLMAHDQLQRPACGMVIRAATRRMDPNADRCMLCSRMERKWHPLAGSVRAHASLVAACCKLLALQGVPHTRLNQVAHRRRDGSWHSPGADVGAPDIIACVGARTWCLECKTGNARPRPEQRAALERWRQAGALVLVVRNAAELVPYLAAHPAKWPSSIPICAYEHMSADIGPGFVPKTNHARKTTETERG